MQNIRRKLAVLTRKIFDLLVMTLCFFLAVYESWWQADSISFGNFLSMRVRIDNFLIFAALLLCWHAIFTLSGQYRSRRLSSLGSEAADVVKATSASSVLLAPFGLVFSLSVVGSLHFILIFWAASTSAIGIARLAARSLLKALRLRGKNLSHLLIVGTNQRAIEYAEKIQSKPQLGYCLLGFAENDWTGNEEFRLRGYRVVTNFENFPDFIRRHVVDEVMLCLPFKSQYERSSEIIRSCEEQGITVRVLPDLFDLDRATSRTETIDGTPVITFRTGAMEEWAILIKRAIDIVLSTVALLLLAPCFGVVALLIKLTSEGPVFFVQERLGLNKRKFRLYKFRTMVANAERLQKQIAHLNEVSGPVFKIKNDPRITRIGKYLRKTSLDEFPQFINVLKGDMSLVGPRPPIASEVRMYVRPHLRRLSIKPGLTCLWQVNGRNSIEFDKWMELDQQYIDQWSLWLDMKIIGKTVLTVLRGSGE